ncbi:hypothetical protein LIER_39371 [Lithospermum erythrorhizon]|uniref:Uncharacterized protein n=1 Tax=Lithospermum erythrorhizon TaxID=34254 RepID=A0AAV3QHT7_LITER
MISESMAAENDDGGNKSQAVPVLRPCLRSGTSSDGSQKAPLAGMSLVFKAGSSGSGSEAKATGSSVRGPKFAGAMLQRARKALLRGSDARLGAGSAPKRPQPPTPLPIRPEAAVPRAIPAGPPEGAKVDSPRVPVVNPIPVVNPEPVIPPRVTRSKTRVKTRNDAPPKESLLKVNVNVPTVNGSLSEVAGSEDMVISPSNKGNGLKGVDKGKTIVSQIPVVSPNSFEALNVSGGGGGTHDEDVIKIQRCDLAPSPSGKANQDNEGGVWQHVSRKGHSNGHGGAVSFSVSPCG